MNVRCQIIVLLVLSGAQALVDFACGDVLRQTDGAVIYGRLTSESEAEIVFHERVDANNYIERRISRERIAVIVRTIDEHELSKLDPAQPEAYRRLAEELAGWRSDPEARAVAIRLYLIAASLLDGLDRRHCLLALIELSRNSDERSRMCEFAFWLDMSLPRTVLRSPIPSSTINLPNQTIGDLIRTVQAVRSGASEQALEVLRKPESQALLEQTKNICSAEQLELAAMRNEHNLEELNALIKLELALRKMSRGGGIPDAIRSWYQQSQDGQLARWEFPTWSNVTEFDPSASVFRQRQWLMPSGEK